MCNDTSSSLLVSVLVPVYKGESFLTRTLQSAFAQTHTELEVIVVNDGSPDNSEAIIKPFLSDSRVRYIKQANAGVAAARNTAIKHATGDYFALLDQDDLWHPEKLARQIELFKSNPQLGLVHCHAAPVDAQGDVLPADPWRPRPTRPNAFQEIFLGNPIQACAGMFSREAVDSVGGFDDSPKLRFADEYDLWLRISARFEVGYVPETMAWYRLHGENNSADVIQMAKAAMAVLDKTRNSLPEVVTAINGQHLHERYGRLYLNMAIAHSQEGLLFSALPYFLRAAWLAPSLTFLRLLGPAGRNRWEWYLQRFRKNRGDSS